MRGLAIQNPDVIRVGPATYIFIKERSAKTQAFIVSEDTRGGLLDFPCSQWIFAHDSRRASLSFPLPLSLCLSAAAAAPTANPIPASSTKRSSFAARGEQGNSNAVDALQPAVHAGVVRSALRFVARA